MKIILVICLVLTTPVVWAQSSSFLSAARQAYQEGNFLVALENYQNALKTPSESQPDQALLGQAKTFFALFDYENTLKSLESLMSKYPHSSQIPSAIYWEARVALAQKDPQTALTLWDGYLKTSPNGTDAASALFWMAEASQELGKIQVAKNLYQKLMDKFPTSTLAQTARYRLTILEFQQQDERLVNLLRWSNTEALNATAEYQRREREFEQALFFYQKKLLSGLNADGMAEIISLQQQITQKDAQILSLKAQIANGGTGSNDALAKLDTLKLEALELKDFFLEWRLSHEKP